ncbi:hypothetical protein ACH41A_19155, partial [Streptomyces wuyuanensis]|uniref:hypothetical protein n=1 Tax=Streptomyces wuyuanensis TaxID=1196353 RepID=UPI0037AB518D
MDDVTSGRADERTSGRAADTDEAAEPTGKWARLRCSAEAAFGQPAARAREEARFARRRGSRGGGVREEAEFARRRSSRGGEVREEAEFARRRGSR